MKILFLSRRFYPCIGGVEKHVLEISKLLVKKGHKIIILTEERCVGTKINLKNTKIIYLPKFKSSKTKKIKIWIWLWSNRNLILSSDIIHCHDVFFWYIPFAFIYPLKPVFTTFHGYENYPITLKTKVIRKISEKLSWGNICVGDFIPKWYGTKADYVIHGAVKSRNYKKQNSLKKQTITNALFVGRLDDQTNIIEYSKTLDLVRKNYPDFKAYAIGEGPYRNKISNMKILGPKLYPEKHIPKFDIIFASRYLSILEALVCSKPVFAFYSDPVKEDYLRLSTFKDYIYIEKSPIKMAKLIVKYIRNPSLNSQKIKKGYEFANQQNWQKIVEIYLKLWLKKKSIFYK